MSGKFEGDPEAPQGNQGQPQRTADDEPERQEIDLTKINLDDLPQGRALKSKYDKALAEERRRAQKLAEDAAIYRARYEQVINDMNSADPETGKELVSRAELAAREARIAERERAQEELMRQQQLTQQWQAWRQQRKQYAQSLGLNPNDPRIEQALNKAQYEGDEFAIMTVISQMVAEKQAQPAEPEAPQQPQQPARNMPLPPTGGTTPSQKAARKREYEARKAELRKHQGEPNYLAAFTRLQAEFADIL